jgi:hypothetical protein
MIYQAVIKDVDYRDVNRKADGKPIRIYQIHTTDGVKWTTNRKDIATDAFRMVGQQVEIQGRQEENGIYTNYYLDEVHAPGANPPQAGGQWAPPQATGFAPEPPVLAPATITVQPQPITTAPNSEIGPQGPTPTDWAIWRQTAAKVSAHISSGAAEFWANVDDLVNYFAYAIKPQAPSIVPGSRPEPIQPQQNQFIPESAYADPGPEPRPDYNDSDIPFS